MGITFRDSRQQISRGSHKRKGGAEGEEESTWEYKGVEVWSPEGVESRWCGATFRVWRHSREFAELQRQVFSFD